MPVCAYNATGSFIMRETRPRRNTLMALLFLLALSACGIDQHVVFATRSSRPGDPSGALPAGMSHRWRASDLSTTPVTNWVDEIQAYNLVPFSNNTKPTWDSTGVNFWGTNRLTVTNITIDSSLDAYLIVFNLKDTVGPYDLIVAWSSGGQLFLEYVSPGFNDGNGNGTITPVGTTTIDWLYSGLSGGNHPIYTNGVQSSLKGLTGSSFFNIGAGATGSTGGATQQGSKSVIKEIITWTNVAPFSTAQRSNIHWYSTNVYLYSP